MSQVEIVGHKVWCPLCKQHTELRRIRTAAKIVDVHRRTIYRYVDEGLLYSVKIAGKSMRVCTSCLLRQNTEPES